MEKIKQCMQQTKDLHDCCQLPKDEEMKNDPDCKQHLEGIEGKEKKEQHKAQTCFVECIFKKSGIISEGKDIVKDKLKEETEKHLTKFNAPEFKDISMNSIDFCVGECKKKMITKR